MPRRLSAWTDVMVGGRRAASVYHGPATTTLQWTGRIGPTRVGDDVRGLAAAFGIAIDPEDPASMVWRTMQPGYIVYEARRGGLPRLRIEISRHSGGMVQLHVTAACDIEWPAAIADWFIDHGGVPAGARCEEADRAALIDELNRGVRRRARRGKARRERNGTMNFGVRPTTGPGAFARGHIEWAVSRGVTHLLTVQHLPLGVAIAWSMPGQVEQSDVARIVRELGETAADDHIIMSASDGWTTVPAEAIETDLARGTLTRSQERGADIATHIFFITVEQSYIEKPVVALNLAVGAGHSAIAVTLRQDIGWTASRVRAVLSLHPHIEHIREELVAALVQVLATVADGGEPEPVITVRARDAQ